MEDEVRKLIIAIGMTLLMQGCSNVKNDADVEIWTEGHYINNDQSITIATYNSYNLINSEIVQNEDGSYTVTLIIDKPIK